MADNIAITAGSGTNVAADDIGSVFYQRIKVNHGADGSATDTSDAAPLPVRQPGDVFDLTFTLDTSAYADGDILADTQSIASVFLSTTGTRILESVTVLDEDDQGMGLDILFLDANNSLGTENAAPSISDANARSIIGRVSISSADFYDLGGCRFAQRAGIGLPLKGNASTTLYVAAISRGTGTYTASGIRIKLGFT